jgi:Common central domain of tyrosinase
LPGHIEPLSTYERVTRRKEMGIRKNAKFLTPTEREDFVKACVFMKADIVNPAAPAEERYSRWDEYVAIHWMIQDAFAPGDTFVNFGHGGLGSYSFLSWHRYFLFQFERVLQGYVAGVMLPYWDWSDPASIMTDTFLGPNGTASSEVRTGYFARDAPGTGTPVNPTPSPAWWPATLTGWRLPASFGDGSGPLRRGLGTLGGLPNADDLRLTLAKPTYRRFQFTLESGAIDSSGFPTADSLPSFNQMHNGIHGWIGGTFGQMSDPAYSPFDPIFYLHHCNIDRLWAMWQLDGHADEYPATGGQANHRRDDIMYPWTGGAAGYGSNASIRTAIPMPDFSAVGAKHNVDTLDFRNAFGYTYDTLATIGIGLDRTASMNGMTPDPMTVTAPDVSKWEAAKRGVSAFLQDCETVQNSGTVYILAGIKTFRRLAANDFALLFPSPGYGLVKNGSAVSQATFDGAIGSMTPGGSTPLADALLDVQNTLVEPPFGHVPADEQRYLAILTDGLLTAGAPLASIPDHSFTQTAVFGMGFGTGADVDYATIAGLVAKGKSLSTTQVFHGENAGTIDKFYSNALASAIGFTPVFDPVLELFAGEHAHLDFLATSAEEVFLITAQGMDFEDDNWTFHLHGPGGYMVYGHGKDHQHASACGHSCTPDVTATRAKGRLSLVLQRNNSDDSCWVGSWRLMVAYKARTLDAMVMPKIGELIVPVAAGTVRGARFSRLLLKPTARVATRNLKAAPAHRLDTRPLSTNNNTKDACNVVVNIYARTRLRLELQAPTDPSFAGEGLKLSISSNVLMGNITTGRTFGRLIAPAYDLAALVSQLKPADIPKAARLRGSRALKFDPARVLAALEKKDPNLAAVQDHEVRLVSHEGSDLHVHIEKTEVAGVYHFGFYIEGSYCPEHSGSATVHDHDHEHDHSASEPDRAHDHSEAKSPNDTCSDDCCLQSFSRILNLSVPVAAKKN